MGQHENTALVWKGLIATSQREWKYWLGSHWAFYERMYRKYVL